MQCMRPENRPRTARPAEWSWRRWSKGKASPAHAYGSKNKYTYTYNIEYINIYSKLIYVSLRYINNSCISD